MKQPAQQKYDSQVLPISGEEEVDSLWSEVLLDGHHRRNFLTSQNKLASQMLTGYYEHWALEDRGQLGSHTEKL